MPLIVSGTDSITLPVGTTAQRNATPVTGMYRLNSTNGTTEYYNGTNWVTGTIVSGTAVASTSGTSIDFTGIPAGVKRITVMFSGVSTNGTSVVQIQLGTGSTTYTTTGYLSYVLYNGGVSSSTTGFATVGVGAADTRSGQMIISNHSGNIWTETCGYAIGTNGGAGGGGVSLAAALTAVRITTVNGTDTFDAGSINILYE